MGWDGWPETAASVTLDPRARLAALLLLLATPEDRPERADGDPAGHDQTVGVIDRLRRRTLPWTAATARLAVTTVMTGAVFDDQRVAVALRGAETVCAAGAADVGLVDALEEGAVWLDDLPVERWRVPEMRLYLRRVLAAAAPPELLDLSVIRHGDGWGEQARAAARAANADEIAPLVRLLGQLGARKPSQLWLRSAQEALGPMAAVELLRSWLELAAWTDVVPPDETVAFSGGMLFAPGNDDVVRAAVLAASLLPTQPWVPDVLGVLARRGAATSGEPGMTASLALKVAGAAIDTLATRGTPDDQRVLEDLLDDVSRRDLVKRIGAALGQEGRASERDQALRRDKAAAVRRKADPAPRHERASVDVLLRRHVGPELRRQGFKGSGRTWRRIHDDRVDVVAFGSSGTDVQFGYGTRFDAVHPAGEPFPVERAMVRDFHLDVRLSEGTSATAAELDRCAERLRAVIVPFLDTLGRYEFARDYFEDNRGVPAGATAMENPGSPDADGKLGMLAAAAGDKETAVACLTRRLAAAESWAARDSNRDDVRADVAYWRTQLAKAERLP